MTTAQIVRRALRDFKEGSLSEEAVLELLRDLPYEDLEFAKVDHHRGLRHGFPEVIFGRGKTNEQVCAIAEAILKKHPNLLITAASEEVAAQLKQRYSEVTYHPESRALTIIGESYSLGRGRIAVLAAGTADIPVADEALVTARIMGNEAIPCYDVGVAGLHRILSQKDLLDDCTVAIVVAGMEGALPSVVGGLVDLPIIAVPTSVGYGASFGGLAALLSMLNSCASSVAVVNIDNGFGAGYVASLINRDRSLVR